MIKNGCWSLSQILMKLEFFGTNFCKNAQILNFTKICPMEAELFHVDGGAETEGYGTDRNDEANSRFSQFWERI
jgi:hypothetical protein